jgi:hypothetical protein
MRPAALVVLDVAARTVVLFVLFYALTRVFDAAVAAHRRGMQRVRNVGGRY